MLTIIIIGAGINGVVSAIELKRRGHRVTLLDPGPIPHPLAASTDISKAVRSCYGADEDYTALAERAIARWREWNNEFGVELYHENGVLFLTREEMKAGGFEYETFRLLKARGHKVERMTTEKLRLRFPAFNAERFRDGVYDPEGGYAESGHAVSLLLQRALEAGVQVREATRFAALDEKNGGIAGVVVEDGGRLEADVVVAATGSWTPHLFPFTAGFFRSTGHPVFHLQPNDPTPFHRDHFPMFGADIAQTGYYGFPATATGVVKFGLHGPGREIGSRFSGPNRDQGSGRRTARVLKLGISRDRHGAHGLQTHLPVLRYQRWRFLDRGRIQNGLDFSSPQATAATDSSLRRYWAN